jgi:MoxR-like ATPase
MTEQLEQLHQTIDDTRAEVAKVILGQKSVVDQALIVILSRQHALIEGVPGIAKTLLVRTLARVLGCDFARIQFTPDLMPADITGTEILQDAGGERRMVFVRGPIFGNIILADEINRTPPKTQAALLEAMQEYQVTAAGVRHPLEQPFFVLATQNPIEMEGTYPLPEAQLDRFMFNVVIDYLPELDEVDVVRRTTSITPAAIQTLFNGADVLRFHEIVRKVPIADEIVRYAVQLAAASRPHQPTAPDFVNEMASWGAGTRAGQYLVLGAKARALLKGRAHVAVEDIRTLAAPVLRHRILLNYRAEANGLRVENVVERLLQHIKYPLPG